MPQPNHPIEVEFPAIPVPVKQVLRRLGYPADHQIEPGMRQIIDAEIEASVRCFNFQGIYTIFKIESLNVSELTFQETSFSIKSAQVAKMLKQASQVVLFMVTIGEALETKVKELLRVQEPTRAFILDAIGSETADALADHLHWQILSDLAEENGMRVTPRFSPGYGDWPVTIQPEFHRVCQGNRIGISVTDSSLMIPRKSVSAVLGFTSK